ncbi:DUF1190 domain-containing protein [Microvirga sp. VF16]|uniref:DUF1190 domain-containing protein n=1 Tax=Microvirga sp. VF16 TaxID=2807101 RepID=UPI00193CFDE0|nr:DUF1190 domain-containing protein [Microvirga sp. VF16]
MQCSPATALRAVVLLSGLLLPALPLQAETRNALYVTSRNCQTDGLLSTEQCRNAFANAEAEYYDRVPVFDRKEECERQFRRCAISFAESPDPNALRFVPAMKGVQVTVNSERVRTVVPVLDDGHSAISFNPRTVLERQDFRSSKPQQAQVERVEPQSQSDASTWVLRGRVDAPVLKEPEVPLPSLIPSLITWCSQYCEAFSGRGNRTSHLSPVGTELFVPMLDAGARPYELIETRHFKRLPTPAPKNLPHFIR